MADTQSAAGGKKKRAPAKPKPIYVLVTKEGGLISEVNKVTRNANDAIAWIDGQSDHGVVSREL